MPSRTFKSIYMKKLVLAIIIAIVGLCTYWNLGSENNIGHTSLYHVVHSDTLFIGLWKGIDKSEVGYLSLEKEGFAYFVIGNDTLGGSDFMQGGHRASMTYEIDYSTSPNSIDFVVYSKELNNEVGRLPGIFEFIDRRKVRLSLNFTDDKRPDNFNEGDDMIVLKKVNSK